MKIKLKSDRYVVCVDRDVKAGETIDVPADDAKSLVEQGHATKVGSEAKPKSKPTRARAPKEAAPSSAPTEEE